VVTLNVRAFENPEKMPNRSWYGLLCYVRAAYKRTPPSAFFEFNFVVAFKLAQLRQI
jgi:hypothetical protein